MRKIKEITKNKILTILVEPVDHKRLGDKVTIAKRIDPKNIDRLFLKETLLPTISHITIQITDTKKIRVNAKSLKSIFPIKRINIAN